MKGYYDYGELLNAELNKGTETVYAMFQERMAIELYGKECKDLDMIDRIKLVIPIYDQLLYYHSGLLDKRPPETMSDTFRKTMCEQWISEALDEASGKLFRKKLNDTSAEEFSTVMDYMEDKFFGEWFPISMNGIDFNYEINLVGDIKSLLNNYVLKSGDVGGYRCVTLFSDGVGYQFRVHQILASCTIPNPDNKPQVNHIDGHKDNNWYLNLEWVTPQENIRHAVRTGLISVKYSDEEVTNVCKILMEHPELSFVEIGIKTDMHPSVIASIYHHQYRPYISETYDFPKKCWSSYAQGEDAGSAKFTEEQIIRVCELLSSDRFTSTEKISDLTGVSTSTIGNVYRRETWNSVSKDYIFPFRNDKYELGESNPASIYTNEQVRKVCDLLMDSHLTYDDISQMTGVAWYTVGSIYRGAKWPHISSEYRFPPRETCASGEASHFTKYSDEQVKDVCELLMNPAYTYKQIEELSGVPKQTIIDIYKKRWRKYISKDYDFPMRDVYEPSEKKIRVKDMLDAHMDREEMAMILKDTFEVESMKEARILVSRYMHELKIQYPGITDYLYDENGKRRVDGLRGTNHPGNKYTKDQILKVIELLMDPNLSYTDIENATGVDNGTVGAIKRKKLWTDLTEGIEFPYRSSAMKHPLKGENHPSNKYAVSQIRQVCDLLMDKNKTFSEISAETGVPVFTIGSIYRGENWTDVSKGYAFPQRVAKFDVGEDTLLVRELLKEGKSLPEIRDIIMKKCSIGDPKKAYMKVTRAKHYLSTHNML